MVNSFQEPVTIFSKNFALDVWLFEDTTATMIKLNSPWVNPLMPGGN